MKTVAISGSASLQLEANKWVRYFSERGYEVVESPKKLVDVEQEYPKVFTDFFTALDKVDVLFVMNEDKNGVGGYIGPATFAECSYVVVRNQRGLSKTEIVLCKEPAIDVPSYQEVMLWLQYGWVKLFKDTV